MKNFIHDLPLLWNILIFIFAAGLVWGTGVRLSKYADQFIEKTGVSEVFIGTLGLALITSLPELATTLSATLTDNVDMAINNLFGSIALQVTLLAVGDFMIRNSSLSGSLENPVSRLQATCLSFLLALAALAVIYQDFAIFHVGIWSVVIFGFYLVFFFIINYFKKLRWWLTEPNERESIGKVKAVVSEKLAARAAAQKDNPELKEKQEMSEVLFSSLGLYFLLTALGILLGGYLIANSADAIAQKTGLGSGFMGFFFVGLTTSLPELSTTISAARLKRYRMAFSNIFGTNMLNVGMVLVADLFYLKGPALNEVDNFAAAGAIFGILLTSIYQIGLTIKYNKTFFRLGIDSILVLFFYLLGAFILYQLQST